MQVLRVVYTLRIAPESFLSTRIVDMEGWLVLLLFIYNVLLHGNLAAIVAAPLAITQCHIFRN